jgi:hypothetical protein
MYHTFGYVLKHILNSPCKYTCVFENRPTKYKFGAKNYGEIPHFLNKADGDPWDVFAPGHIKPFTYNKQYVIDKIIGVYFLENGNHKIAVRIKDFPIKSHKYENDIIKKYTKKYSDYTKIKGIYIPFNKLINRH